MTLFDTIKEQLGCMIKDTKLHNEKRIYITVDKQDIKECADIIFHRLDGRYIIASAIDNCGSFEILYHFGFDRYGAVVSLRVFLEREKPEISSLTDIIPGIVYIEREIWELFGISFTGHPGLKHFLLRDDWPEEKYPLRKNITTGGDICE